MSEPTAPTPVIFRGQDVARSEFARLLVCPGCGELVTDRAPDRWLPAWGPVPTWAHVDGEPLCPVVADTGYAPAPQPVTQRVFDDANGCRCDCDTTAASRPRCTCWCTCTDCTTPDAPAAGDH